VDRETANALRGQAVRGVVAASNDGGMVQSVDVETHEGVVRSGVEVLQQYGVTSRAPAGGLVVLLALGGDEGDQVALPVASPSDRMGGLADGEVALHDAGGNRVHLKAGGTVEIQGATAVFVKVGGTEFEVTAGGVRILGTVQVDGSIQTTGDVMAGSVSLLNHEHGNGNDGANTTGPV
jgi:phage baseplate assembly protein V